MDNKVAILLVEDNPGDARLIQEMLKDISGQSFIVEIRATLAEALSRLSSGGIDVIVSDLSLPDSQGLDTFFKIKNQDFSKPILLLTGLRDEEIALTALRSGAQDYLVKGHIDSNLLAKAIRYAIERKQIEARLSAEKHQLAVTLASIADGVITTDVTGKVILINSVAQKLTGWAEKDAVGRPLTEIFSVFDEKTGAPLGDLVDKTIKSDRVGFLPIGTALNSRSGGDKKVEDSIAPIKDDSGNIVGVVIVFRDASERAKIEQELVKAHKLEALGVLAGGIAHDFNNILTAILNNIGYSKINIDPSSEMYSVLTDAEKATIKAKDLTQQLLTFSRGGVPIKKTILLGDIIREQIKFILRGSNVKDDIVIVDDAWPVDVDVGQFNQVINNLIINAKQAMPEGGEVQVKLENVALDEYSKVSLPKGRYVKISVKDNGYGIPQKYLVKIFDPYFTTKQEGSGLGLAVTYSIIKRHHGDITVESEQGKGTMFSFYLPASENKFTESAAPGKALQTGQGKILLMDDDEMIIKAVGRLVDMLGYHMETTKDGASALEVYKSAMQKGVPFDAVILDLTIPGGMGGQEALVELLKIDPKVKAIVSSGYSNNAVMSDYKHYGFKGVIAKPYEVQVLSQVLHDVISGK